MPRVWPRNSTAILDGYEKTDALPSTVFFSPCVLAIDLDGYENCITLQLISYSAMSHGYDNRTPKAENRCCGAIHDGYENQIGSSWSRPSLMATKTEQVAWMNSISDGGAIHDGYENVCAASAFTSRPSL